MILATPSVEALRAFAPDVCVIGSGLGRHGDRAGARRPRLPGAGARERRRRSPTRRPRISRARRTCAPTTTSSRIPRSPAGSAAPRTSGPGAACRSTPSTSAPGPGSGLTAWPITEADLAPYLAPALDALEAGAAVFTAPLAGVAADPAFRCDTLERWSNAPQIQKHHRRTLGRATGPPGGSTQHGDRLPLRRGRPRSPALELHLDGEGGGAAGRAGHSRRRRQCQHPAAAARAGAAIRRASAAPDGPLGRFYMGHLSGQIADIVFGTAGCTTSSTTTSTRTAPTSGAAWCRARRRPRRRSDSPTSPSGRWCRRSPTPRTARGRCRRCSSRCRSRRSGGG